MKKHLIQAADRGDTEAQFNLGIMYENGFDDSRYAVEGGRPEAMRWLPAAAEQGLPRAQIKLAEIYAGEPKIPENSVKACGWYLLATTSLCGAHLQKAQSAYQRATFLLTPSSNRSRALRARLEAKVAHHGGNVGSAGNARGGRA
jgi:hypothetical protein